MCFPSSMYQATHLSTQFFKGSFITSCTLPVIQDIQSLIMYSHISVLIGQMWYGQNLVKRSVRPDVSQKQMMQNDDALSVQSQAVSKRSFRVHFGNSQNSFKWWRVELVVDQIQFVSFSIFFLFLFCFCFCICFLFGSDHTINVFRERSVRTALSSKLCN